MKNIIFNREAFIKETIDLKPLSFGLYAKIIFLGGTIPDKSELASKRLGIEIDDWFLARHELVSKGMLVLESGLLIAIHVLGNFMRGVVRTRPQSDSSPEQLDFFQPEKNFHARIDNNNIYNNNIYNNIYDDINIKNTHSWEIEIEIEDKEGIGGMGEKGEQGERDKGKNHKRVKKKVTLQELSVDHISEWLVEKRSEGKYLNHDEFEVLEYFKNYCLSKGKRYADYTAAFRNAFEWERFEPKSRGNRVIESKQAAITEAARRLGII